MARPKNRRQVSQLASVTYFKPRGVLMRDLDEVVLAHEEIEALRLSDVEDLKQAEAARQMRVSRPTYQRVLREARQKVACGLVNGLAIRVEGGEWQMTDKQNVAPRRGRGLGPNFAKASMGARGRMGGGLAAGPGGKCVCTNSDCDYSVAHQIGVPCTEKTCPKCGSQLTREA